MTLLKYKKIAFSISLFILSFNFALARENDLIKKAEDAFENKNFIEAANAFSEVIKINPKNKDAFYYRGLSYLYLEEAAQAERDFTDLIKLDSSLADAYNSRGLSRGYKDDIDGAIIDFRKAVDLDPGFAEAYLNLGSAYMTKNQFDLALPFLDRVVEIDSSNPEIFFMRGTAHYLTQSFENAVADFTKTLDLGLKLDKVYYNRANSYYKLAKFHLAIEDFCVLLEMDKYDIEARNNRALVFQKIGQHELAAKDWLDIELITLGIEDTPDIDSLVFRAYKFQNDIISIDLPNNWISVFDSVESEQILIIAKDSIISINDFYHIGVRISYEDSINKKFGVNSEIEMLEFWERNQQINADTYLEFEELNREKITKDGLQGYIKEIRFVYDEKNFPVKLFEIVLVKSDKLIFTIMQSPELKFDYYKSIFEKAIDTMKINL